MNRRSFVSSIFALPLFGTGFNNKSNSNAPLESIIVPKEFESCSELCKKLYITINTHLNELEKIYKQNKFQLRDLYESLHFALTNDSLNKLNDLLKDPSSGKYIGLLSSATYPDGSDIWIAYDHSYIHYVLHKYNININTENFCINIIGITQENLLNIGICSRRKSTKKTLNSDSNRLTYY